MLKFTKVELKDNNQFLNIGAFTQDIYSCIFTLDYTLLKQTHQKRMTKNHNAFLLLFALLYPNKGNFPPGPLRITF